MGRHNYDNKKRNLKSHKDFSHATLFFLPKNFLQVYFSFQSFMDKKTEWYCNLCDKTNNINSAQNSSPK